MNERDVNSHRVTSPAQFAQRVLRVTRANWPVLDRRAGRAMRQAGLANAGLLQAGAALAQG